MAEKRSRISVVTICSLFTLPLCGTVYAAYAASDEPSAHKQAATVAVEQADVAREEAEIAREAAALEQRKAALAEKKAEVARKQARILQDALTETSPLVQELDELRAKETERGLVLTLGDVLFESNKAELRADSMRTLYPLVTLLKERPQRSVVIEGYTDSSGAESYNQELSQERAAAVRDFLVSNGIQPERIMARGYGEAHPVAPNTTEAERQENRRVEVIVLREGERVAERIR
jgi:OOP family OmpA-OmpF porin